MNYSHIYYSAKSAFVAALIFVLVVTVSYLASEPIVSQSAVENFTVTQTITGEISFAASTTAVTMDGTLAGVTGGTSYGTTTARVQTNNSTGYNMTIKFSDATAMQRNGGGGSIGNYLYSTSTASYPIGFDTSPVNGQFGFSVNASTTADISDVFKHNGTDCGPGPTFTVNNCWRGASTTVAAETELMNRTSATPASGSTSTVQFRVTIPNNPSPSIPNGTYTATATLTAVANP